MTRDEIAKLSGRELDAAVHSRVFGKPITGNWICRGLTPLYSDSDCRGLAEMIAKARSMGWWATIEELDGWHVTLDNTSPGGRVKGRGSSLPEAFARALLMATILQEAS